MKKLVGSPSSEPQETGFTLTELAVVVLTIALLALVLLPAHAASRTKSQSLRCLDHLKQFMGVVMMYTHDNHDFLPPNEDSSSAPPGHIWVRGNAATLRDATNILLLTEVTNNVLAPYTASSINLYKCPADPGRVFSGGVRVQTIRSISMNHAVGTVCPAFRSFGGHSGVPTLPTNGPWLDGNHSHITGNPFRCFGKVSDFVNAANTWVIMDEHYNSINDAGLAHPGLPPGVNIRWVDFPAIYHHGAGGIAYADGRSEIKKWKGLNYPASGLPPNTVIPGANREDWDWLAERTSQRAR